MRVHASVYNAPSRKMIFSSRAALLVSVVLLIAFPAKASQWQAPAAQLAAKIAAATGPGAVHLNVANRSSLAGASVEELRRALASELSARGLSLVDAEQAAALVDVTLSENLQANLLVAEIRQGNNESSVVMVAVPRTQADLSNHQSSTLTLRKTLLWSDETRILDVAFLGGNLQHMLVLEPENVGLYSLAGGQWKQEQSLAIAHAHPWPRDLRGRLILRKDQLFDVYLPGVFCRSSKLGVIDCRASDDPWPLSPDPVTVNAFFTPTRNFFTGVLSPGIRKQTSTTPFYSAASLPRNQYTLWIFAGVDGQVRLLDGLSEQIAPQLGWGSDIATVHSGCGSGWQVLATGFATGPSDTVTAFEIPDREILAASQALDFKGNITALWTEADGSSAIAVGQDRDSRKYEAYRLTIACSQ